MRTVLHHLALLVLTTSTAAAGSHELSLGSSGRALRSDSANALTEDSLVGGALGYEHALDIAVLPDLAVWVTGMLGWGVATGTMFQTLGTEIDTTAFALGGRARYPLRRWLNATARLDVGTTRAHVALRDGSGHSAADSGWGATVHGALGGEVILLRSRSRFSLGLRAELGYVMAQGIDLVATPDATDDDTLQLAMTAASLGRIDLSGPMFSLALTSQF